MTMIYFYIHEYLIKFIQVYSWIPNASLHILGKFVMCNYSERTKEMEQILYF